MEKLRTRAQEDTVKGKVIASIIAGCHTTEAIIENAGLFTQYRDFCDAIAELHKEGVVVCERDIWGRWGYYFTENALKNI